MIKLMLLLLVANGAPILARRITGRRFTWPIDHGFKYPDGRPLLGKSKTWLGLASSLLITPLAGILLFFSWWIGILIAVGAMTGDLLSSFVKRRLGMDSSDMALGLDQVPESLIPLLLVAQPLGLSVADILLLTMVFFVIELLLSKILFHLHIRKKPY